MTEFFVWYDAVTFGNGALWSLVYFEFSKLLPASGSCDRTAALDLEEEMED